MTDPRPLLRELLGGPVVAYHPRLARLVGGVKAAVLLCQLYYLANQRPDPDAAFGASLDELQSSTGLSAKEQFSARQELIRRGLVSVSRKGSALGRNQYHVDIDALVGLAAGQLSLLPLSDSPNGRIQIIPMGESRLSESAHLDSPNGSISTKNPEKKKRRAPSGRAAPASRPPAIELYHRILHRWPPKRVWLRVDRTVGREFADLLRWGRILRRWSLADYNRANYLDLIEVFRNGWRERIPGTRSPDGRKPHPDYDPAADMAAFKRRRGMR